MVLLKTGKWVFLAVGSVCNFLRSELVIVGFTAIDLFAGCGGLSEGIRTAGFDVLAAVEINEFAVEAYRINHTHTSLFRKDIRTLDPEDIKDVLDGRTLHLLAGCPPCQGFSSIRRLNRKAPVDDDRNDLILEYLRFVKALEPVTIMMENVPGIIDFHLFKQVHAELSEMGYQIDFDVVDVADYGVPQRRKRFVMVGSRLGPVKIARGNGIRRTVRDVIGNLYRSFLEKDPINDIYPRHTVRINEMIKRIPKDGGSRRDLPDEYILNCHRKDKVGFNDVYGRLKWDDVSSTITGGCLNPSKGRFLHPQEDRCITAREAALLQTFPFDYKFPTNIPKGALALMIGNALPPLFSEVQSRHIFSHLAQFGDFVSETKEQNKYALNG
ncbi:DNA cytosine methyltransferase [Alicyclobacillus sp. SP_1]|uniref:DNA cytosine methyltransferase n=1 Tax=Alicyclobacillus sp. SP_1 TaxID=2942475 RepID=UPI002157F0B6|nr:DNA cytosine methyltransferase [Alicyclobacillus sp. SP_1]